MASVKREGEYWSEEDSATFEKFGDCFVPRRKEQIATICDLVQRIHSPLVFDVCCGDGSISEGILACSTEARVVGLDSSRTMLDATELRLQRYKSRFDSVLFDIADLHFPNYLGPPDIVFSSLAVHHLSDDDKKEFFKQSHKALSNDGMFILCDLVEPTGDVSRRVFARQWDNCAMEQSIDYFENDSGYQKFKELTWNHYEDPNPDPIDKPAYLFDQMSWLKKTGYSTVDLVWFYAGHAIVVAVK